ncbi:hypothetical protein HDU76_013039 [Blyttiomyces sp. JEL0837]|nr:hypothetical protein HDU76_013039 [Blyttiomyces sp. JEL0837]
MVTKTLIGELPRTPFLVLLVSAVGGTLAAGGLLMAHRIRDDPHLVVVNKKDNPYPWLNVDQNTNLKLYAVNRKFDKNAEKKKVERPF